MLPAIVLPFHDPTGLLLSHLKRITPQLKQIFAHAFVSISPKTQQLQAEWVQLLAKDSFFKLNFNQPGTLAGDHYLAGYRNAIEHSQPEQVLHLCDIDKVAFALQDAYREQFVAHIHATTNGPLPLLFQRSQRAWQTYPENYRTFEHFAISVGQIVFKRYLDFAWSHFVIQAQHLNSIIPELHRRDFSLTGEIVLLLHDQLHTKEVDWLSWEDPFIEGIDPETLKRERENSKVETHKRLSGMLPFLEILLQYIEESEDKEE